MAETKIEWTATYHADGTVTPGYTANLWWGCVEVHSGCNRCYARVLDKRYGGNHWGARSSRRAIASVWSDLARWQRQAAAAGRVDKVFCGSMMDIFERSRPLVDKDGNPLEMTTGELRRRLFEEVIPQSPNLLFLLLTKRPQNIRRLIPERWKAEPPANVMYGYSAVNQETADRGIPHLLRVPGRRFLSCEPLLGPIDLRHIHDRKEQTYYDALNRSRFDYIWYVNGMGKVGVSAPIPHGIDWVICGGESGHGARPMHPQWARELRDQCVEAHVPFHFKQWGHHIPKTQIADLVDGRWVTRQEWRPVVYGGSKGSPWGLLRYDGTYLPETTPWNGRQEDPQRDYEVTVFEVGKKAAGRLLDNREWNESPKPFLWSVR